MIPVVCASYAGILHTMYCGHASGATQETTSQPDVGIAVPDLDLPPRMRHLRDHIVQPIHEVPPRRQHALPVRIHHRPHPALRRRVRDRILVRGLPPQVLPPRPAGVAVWQEPLLELEVVHLEVHALPPR